MARKWIKLWVNESLNGTIRWELTPAERGCWYELLLLAGDSRLNGVIAPGEGMVYPLEYIASRLNISLELLNTTITKCQNSKRIECNGHGIVILNWDKYQSEYQRQKPYRENKKALTREEEMKKFTEPKSKYGKLVLERMKEMAKKQKEHKKHERQA